MQTGFIHPVALQEFIRKVAFNILMNLNLNSYEFVLWYFERLENVFIGHKTFSFSTAGIYSAVQAIFAIGDG